MRRAANTHHGCSTLDQFCPVALTAVCLLFFVVVPSSSIRVEAEMELKFMLYRHWSLYESMYHSNYVASRLQVPPTYSLVP